MLKTFLIDGKPIHTIEKLNFSIKGIPYLITDSSNPDNQPAFHVVKNLISTNKSNISHKRLIDILLQENLSE